MKKKIFMLFRFSAAAIMIAACLASAGLLMPQAASAASGQGKLRILATTYPVYLLARNVVQSNPGAQVDLLIPAQTGCPHDYALTPKDMQKLAQADVLLLNGLGLDDFMLKALPNAKPGLVVVDSSAGVVPLKENSAHEDGDEDHDGHEHAARHGHEESDHGHDHDHDHGHHHDHGGINPHAFASPSQAAIMVKNMAQGLAKADPQNAASYESSASAYEKVLSGLSERLAALGAKAPNRGIALMHDALSYMAHDAGLEVVAVIQENEEAQPSAGRLIKVAEILREHKPALIASEPQYSDKAVQTLAREVGIPAAQLDSLASGPASPALDHYEKIMSNNINILEKYFEPR
ncbi:MAG: zinc ABC transporter substrate-binding protein [Desulfovibrio sp. MES5]|uniref:metal ABC transporter substrate-binding protein n=1 Tax=Desulfovibrio sp. MES5 TaxID=1899016 RepID=UPI000B9CF5FB|nr:metal ABC transporter substrate-binding protein [Desulfovibrio sp. MES5]OXS29812.1 MAG: zinc ABC transporter substrate-binding protein [Desulfovibrio sp. MES5]